MWPSSFICETRGMAMHTLIYSSGMILAYQTTRMGFEPTTSAVTGRRSNQLSHQAKSIIYLMYI